MNILFLECGMGAAGDMLMAALLELCDNKDAFINKINSIGLENVRIAAHHHKKCGICGTKITVEINGKQEKSHDHDHNHGHGHGHVHGSDMDRIEKIIRSLDVSEYVKINALDVYKKIAQAESAAHGVAVTQIHFHEVGEMDAIADIVGVCMLMEQLNVDRVVSSPINLGGGYVECAHGILPVPTPATIHILENVPAYGGEFESELCTPTGAALITHFAHDFGSMPLMSNHKVGYGMGSKDFEKANCLRAFLGKSQDVSQQVVELVCNIDDMTAEHMAFAGQVLMDAGALDVYTTAITMKKGRLGVAFTCICDCRQKEQMLSLMFKHTTTFGVRERICNRYVLDRHTTPIQTEYGDVLLKKGMGFGVERRKFEYKNMEEIAKKNNLDIIKLEEDLTGLLTMN